MATLAEIRAKLKAAENRNTENRTMDNSSYPFWNLKDGGESVLRFLPDGNPNNTFFWAERAMIRLPFPGIKGETDNREVNIQVPCMEMYGESCPVLTEVRTWFKDPALEDMGKKYWKKRSYIFQGFVTEDGLKEETIPENPIRRFIIGPQIFTLIRSALVDPELEELPTDFIHGLDFRMKKGSKGGYADYSTSTWSRRERPLNDRELDAIKQYSLYDLSTFLPKKPSEVELKVITEMFEASVDGEPYDMERWGQYFKPSGMALPSNSGDAVKPTVAAPKVQEDDVPFDDATPARETASTPEPSASAASSSDRAQNIMEIIRNRKK